MRTLLFTAILVLLTSCCSCPPRQVIIEYRIVPASQPTQHRPEANRALREAGRRAAQRVNQLIYHDMKATPTEIEPAIERKDALLCPL